MNERPTPETDAEHQQFAMGGFTLDFCRKLERERDEARELLESEKITRNHIIQSGIKMQKERDEAREAFSELWQYADALLPEIDEETLNRWNKCIKLY